MERLDLQQKERTLLGLEKIHHLQCFRSSAMLSAIIYCPQLCQILMKYTDLRSDILSVVYFLSGVNKILPSGLEMSVIFLEIQ